MTEKFKTDENNKFDYVIKLITTLQEQNKTIVTQNNIISNELKGFKLHIQAEVTGIKGNIPSIHKEISDVIDSQQFHLNQFESQKVVQEYIITHHSKLETGNQMLLDKISALEGELKKEKHDRNYMENNSRKQNVEISGIPMTRGENCKQLVYKLGIKMGHHLLDIGRIDVAHRLMAGTNNNNLTLEQIETLTTPT